VTDETRTPEEPPRNTLYRKVTKGRRRLTPGRRLLYRIAVQIGYSLGRFFWWSCRIHRVIGLDAARAAVHEHHSLIPVYWHQHMLFGVRALTALQPDGLKIGFLISPSIDGTAPSMLVKKIGGYVIRGSSTHTGAKALKDYYQTIVKEHVSPALTPDGPRGPLHEFKPGAIMLAQLSGKPILPVSIAASRKWTFDTWDRFELPIPFSRIVIAYGEPVKLPRGLDAAQLERRQHEMAERLQDLHALAESALLEPADRDAN
jgi:lysophospholipid acyltransferase (LPLAT)-like uncharacterized protein